MSCEARDVLLRLVFEGLRRNLKSLNVSSGVALREQQRCSCCEACRTGTDSTSRGHPSVSILIQAEMMYGLYEGLHLLHLPLKHLEVHVTLN